MAIDDLFPYVICSHDIRSGKMRENTNMYFDVSYDKFPAQRDKVKISIVCMSRGIDLPLPTTNELTWET